MSKESSLVSDCLGREVLPKKPRGPQATSSERTEVARARKSLTRRWKNVEREFARWLTEHDGKDARLSGLTTSTGRIGDLTHLQADVLSRSFLGEVKNEKAPAKIARYWQKIADRAIDWGKDPILYLKFSDAAKYPVVGKPLPAMCVITQDRLQELLDKEGMFDSRLGGIS